MKNALQAHCGAVRGAAPRFSTTSSHLSLSQSSLGNGGHHSCKSQIPSSYRFSGLSIGWLATGQLLSFGRSSKVNLGEQFILEVLYKVDRDHMLVAWPHSFTDEEITGQRTFSGFDGCFSSSHPFSAILLTRCFLRKSNRTSCQGWLFPTVHDYACSDVALSPDIPRPGCKTLLSDNVSPWKCWLHTMPFINLHSHTTRHSYDVYNASKKIT